ncbi:hypothetical protein TNIN_375921 [Trichonephila inaurata madagascariensis]|uniref:Uncharacterized protein n=1 Tax=Trichonephila inaurata madagascariensis TaxID=2747483 RepID=A0A8X7CN56_9ARAC|nr:hypothetical protein TNIN_375921 [Trichonephila inaurata madagascariensis]
MPIAAKCQENYCSAIETSNVNCRTVDVDRALNLCNKLSTLQHTGQPAPDVWSISLSPLRNLANNIRSIRSLIVPVSNVL